MVAQASWAVGDHLADRVLGLAGLRWDGLASLRLVIGSGPSA
jgi:hypothetical protein